MKRILTIITLITLMFNSCEEEITILNDSRISEIDKVSEQNEILTKSQQVESPSDTSDVERYPYTIIEDSLYIKSLGWNVDSIHDEGDFYIINNELLVYKDTLISQRNVPHERIYGSLIHPAAQHIYLNIDSDNDENLQAFIQAVNEWNSIPNCNLYFSSNHHTFNSTNEHGWFNVGVQIKANPSFANMTNPTECNCSLGIIVEAPLSTNLPGYHIWAITSREEFSNLSADEKKYAFMHALGHLIRLEDSDKNENSIPGTSFSKTSIMTSYSYLKDWNMRWTGITDDDKQDLANIYPLDKLIITKTMILPVSDSQLPINRLKRFKQYEFSTTFRALKRGDKQVRCNYQISGGSYDKYQVNDSTIRVAFNDVAQYTINVILESDDIDSNYVNDLSSSCTYLVLGDSLVYSQSVTLNRPFFISWCYTNKQYPNAMILFSGVETIFDNDHSNISIDVVSNGKAKVKVMDYGHYTITMKAISPTGEVLEQRKLHIEKYYRPQMYIADISYIYDGIYISPFSIDCEICQEDMNQAVPTGNSMWAFDVILDENLKFANRCYIRRYRKYLRHMSVVRRVDVRHVVDTSSYTPMVYMKDQTALYEANIRPLAMDIGNGGLPENAVAEYLPYYAFIVPDDRVWLE